MAECAATVSAQRCAAYSAQDTHDQVLLAANAALAHQSAEGRIEWALERLPGTPVVSSSFGAQAAVMLRLMTLARPDIPVILIDTGYLFDETYRFIDELTARLNLNLKVYRPELSPSWQEVRVGKRWEQGIEGLRAYNAENKVEPMERALRELGAGTWFGGLRRVQDAGREQRAIVEGTIERWKMHPIVDWTDRDVYAFLKTHDLPYHPLWQQGYLSIGDTHSTRALHEVSDVSELRFQGLLRECGINEIDLATL